jgi:putative DNA primase/helicase
VFKICCKLIGTSGGDIGLTSEEALPLLMEWQPEFDEEWFREKLDNAEKYARNDNSESSPGYDPSEFEETDNDRKPGSSGNLPERTVPPQPGETQKERTMTKRNRLSSLVDAFINEHYRLKTDETIKDENLTLRYWRRSYWEYYGKRYVQKDDKTIHGNFMLWLERNKAIPSRSDWSTMKELLEYKVSLKEEQVMPAWIGHTQMDRDIISFDNGLFDVNTGEIHCHGPLWFSEYILPFEYNPKATCPEWLRFLGGVFSKDKERVDLLQEWFGYCLTPDTSQHKALNLYGPPRAGKGTTAEIQAKLLGTDNVSRQRLERFGQRFQYIPVIGKLLNICEEAARMNVDEVKSYIGGDSLVSEDKNGPHTVFKPTARLIITSNHQLQFDDTSGAMDARLIILGFDHDHTGSEDLGLQDRLAAELPGIFNWALEGLRRLRKQGRFTIPAASREAGEELRLSNNPTEGWMAERYEKLPVDSDNRGDWVSTSLAYEDYLDFCECEGIQPRERWSKTRLTKEIRDHFKLGKAVNTEDSILGQRRVWKNLKKRASAPDHNPSESSRWKETGAH